MLYKCEYMFYYYYFFSYMFSLFFSLSLVEVVVVMVLVVGVVIVVVVIVVVVVVEFSEGHRCPGRQKIRLKHNMKTSLKSLTSTQGTLELTHHRTVYQRPTL